MMNCRFGGEPVAAVKIPSDAPPVWRSSQYGVSTVPKIEVGKHSFEYAPLDVPICRFPFELAVPAVYDWP